MKIKSLSLALMIGITNAYADGDVVAPEYWSGTYLGAHFGAGGGTINQSFTDQSLAVQTTFSNPVTTTTGSGFGQRYGDITGSNLDLFVGYNIHFNQSKFIIGGQLEGTLFNSTTMKASGIRYGSNSSVSRSGSTINSNNLTNSTAISETSNQLNALFSFIGRLGFLAKPNALAYALIGGTEGNFRAIEIANSVGGGSSATGNNLSQWALGFTTGGGIEYKLSEHWSILGEYRYLHFSFNQNGSLSSESGNSNELTHTPSSASTSSSQQTTHSNFNFNLGQIGIVYRI